LPLSLGFGPDGYRDWDLDFGFWILGFGFWVLGFGFWVLGFGFLFLNGFIVEWLYYLIVSRKDRKVMQRSQRGCYFDFSIISLRSLRNKHKNIRKMRTFATFA
jgi:hypothetical protein